jgi:superfamily II helicase
MNETFNPEDKEEEPMTDMNTRTEATKLCKKCGRHLTLDRFGKKNGTKDGLQYWCKECLTKSILEARRAKKEAKAQAETVKEPKPIFNPIVAVKDIPDQTLADELRRRGWDVKATRPKTIIEEL